MIIYKIINKINGKLYIGATTKDTVNRRWTYHKRDYRRETHLPLYKAFKKYGIDNFEIIPIKFDIKTRKELDEMEKYFIKLFDTRNSKKGYNCTEGGEGNTMKGKNNPNFGKKNNKLAEFNRSRSGIKLSENHKKKIIKSLTGRICKEETRNKMSISRKKAWENGIYSSEEYRKKISDSQKDRCKQKKYT